MKIFLLSILLLLTIPSAARDRDDPNFCIEGWAMVEETINHAGGGCIIYTRVYYCGSMQTEVECTEHQCGSDPVIVQGCH